MRSITARPTLEDGQRIAAAAYRLLAGRAAPTDLRTLQDYRRSNDRDTANTARFFLDLWAGDCLPCDVEPTREPPITGNVVSITANQTTHDLAHAITRLDVAHEPQTDGAA